MTSHPHPDTPRDPVNSQIPTRLIPMALDDGRVILVEPSDGRAPEQRRRDRLQKVPRRCIAWDDGALWCPATGQVGDPNKRSREQCMRDAEIARAIAATLRELVKHGRGTLTLGRQAGDRTWKRLERSALTLEELAEHSDWMAQVVQDAEDWIEARLRRNDPAVLLPIARARGSTS